MQNQHWNKINQAVSKSKISEQKSFEPIFIKFEANKNFYVRLLVTQHRRTKTFLRIKQRIKKLISQYKTSQKPIKLKKKLWKKETSINR